jgi:hypothetical protein
VRYRSIFSTVPHAKLINIINISDLCKCYYYDTERHRYIADLLFSLPVVRFSYLLDTGSNEDTTFDELAQDSLR